MENTHKTKWKNCMNPDYEKQHRNGRIWGGIIVIGIGAAFLARALGVIMPTYLFTWPMILILAGIYTLGKHGFARPGGLIPLTIGAVFLAEKISPGMQIAHIVWPALIILFGLILLMSPWKKWQKKSEEKWSNVEYGGIDKSSSDFIDIDSIFGGVERNVQSKSFKGGRIDCVFGGADVNLLQADIEGTVVLQINAVFGGIELTVPANWKVQPEVSAILGGIEDKRRISEEALSTEKILILKGTVVFGGVSIKGY